MIDLQSEDLRKGGVAFTTPSSITGQQEDRQALALAFNICCDEQTVAGPVI
jgi:hypothetical protein